jgi:hypothetical protein
MVKYRNRLNAAPDPGIKLSSIKPNIKEFVKGKRKTLLALKILSKCHMIL